MFKSPYIQDLQWLKGNLHTHTENSPCGHYSLDKVIELYTSFKTKYDFLAITDHYNLTKLKEHQELILFSGVEYKRKAYQTLGINVKEYEDDKENEENHQALFNSVVNQGGINIICHPHLNKEDYWPFEKLILLEGYLGIEIYNNNVRLDNHGRAVATDLWDKLLTAGKKVYGFANDDMHLFTRVGGGFNMVGAKEKSKASILESLKNGSFYCSSGVYLKEISLECNTIKIQLEHDIPAEFKLIGEQGRVIQVENGTEVSFKAETGDKYIRIEIKREDGAMAWTQPFFNE